MLILGIETSCDETAVAIVQASEQVGISVRSNVVSSQIKIHAKWGGVVPNLAARVHLKNIIPVIKTSLKEAKIKPQQIDTIAVTQGPGLIPALLVGVNTAKTLSYLWKKPLLGIHHIEGHIFANFIGKISNFSAQGGSASGGQFPISKYEKKIFPILCLVVSGGHTQLVLMKKNLNYEVIGETQDDAAGEAFDKVARILGMGYPGGPKVAEKAEKFKKYSTPASFRLPRPMLNTNDFNFSFSGLKTAVLYTVKNNPEKEKNEKFIQELAFEFQQSTIDVLTAKTLKAVKKFQPRTIMIAGGVSANKELRQQLEIAVKTQFPKINCTIPEMQYCVDNAAMIAIAGAYRWKKMNQKEKSRSMKNWKTLSADANLKLC